MKPTCLTLLVLASSLLAACALTPGGERPEFGESVRHMIATQTHTPGDEALPLQGDKAAAAMEAYRRDTGDRQQFGTGKLVFD